MTTMARPSTPFPHTHNTHILTHGHSASYFHYNPEPYVHASQPLHFHMPSLPVQTPPSLLRRRSSNKSTSTGSENGSDNIASSSRRSQPRASSSDFGLPTMPELVHPIPRRVSTCSTSTASPPMPTTPILGSPSAAPPTPLALPPPAYPKRAAASSSKAQSPLSSFNYDPFSTTTSDGIEIASFYPHTASATQPMRPKFKRRDTPRPELTTLSSLGMSEIDLEQVDEREEHKVLRSVIDGGRWVILG